MSRNEIARYDQALGARLRALRLNAVVKQTELAALLGVQRAAVTRWEQGTRGLSAAMLLMIADRFGVPGCQFLPAAHCILPNEAAPAPPATPLRSAPEEAAIASIVQLLRARPDLLGDVMAHLEAQARAGTRPEHL